MVAAIGFLSICIAATSCFGSIVDDFCVWAETVIEHITRGNISKLLDHFLLLYASVISLKLRLTWHSIVETTHFLKHVKSKFLL